MTVRLNEYMSGRKHLLAALLVAAAAVTLAACGSDDGGSSESEPPDYEAAAQGAPPRLGALHDQADELLPGGTAAFEDRLEELRGYPVVVNKWASWCGPCRAEFPFFQSQAAEHAKRVAFVGVNSNDGEDSAREFLAEFPVPYPSYLDPKLEIAALIDAPVEFPATAFYDEQGEIAYVRRGGYASEDELAADIDRYARSG
jgi:cytochrome c biogenesis protein CcmG, thiol:disulfide interchange protein DsbE